MAVGLVLAVLVAAPASAAWGPSVVLSDGEQDTGTAVAIGADGTEVVAWWQYIDSYDSQIGLRVRPSGGPWGPVQNVSAAQPGQNMYPAVAVDGRGNALVVWIWGSRHVMSAYAPTGQQFEAPREIALDEHGYGTTHTFAGFDAAGNALAIWQEVDFSLHDAVRLPGGDFGPPATIATPTDDTWPEWPSFAMAANGDAIATWNDGVDAVVSVRRGTGAFGPPQRLSSEGVPAGPPHAALDSHGDATVVWADHVDTDTYMRATTLAAGAGGFAPATTLAKVFWFDDEAQVAMSDAGAATVVWSGDSFVPDLYAGVTAVTRPPGGPFGAPELVAPAELGASRQPGVGYDDTGTTFVLWQHYDSTDEDDVRSRILGESRAPDTSFDGAPVTLASMQFVTSQPAFATGPDGGIGAWSYGLSGFGPIAAVEARSEGSSPSPATAAGAGSGSVLGTGSSMNGTAHATSLASAHGPGPSTFCRVPRVIGLTRAAARRRLRHAHCALGSVRRKSSRRRSGRILAQHPAPGARRRGRAPVSVVIAVRD
jgi:hypothetical protein